MFASLIAMVVMGQTYVYPAPNGVPLTEKEKQVQARALAEFEARKPIIEASLPGLYEVKNLMLIDDMQTYYQAMGQDERWTMGGPAYPQDFGAGSGFRSVGSGPDEKGGPPARTLEELKREHSLLKHHLWNVKRLHGHTEGIRGLEYNIRMTRAIRGW
jgi:hypothetical protein